jgi:hypothetical protein
MEAVETLATIVAAAHETSFQEYGEMLRDGRVGEPGVVDESADGRLSSSKKIEQGPPVGVSDGVKDVCRSASATHEASILHRMLKRQEASRSS